jgi:probable O-glycosylation ligase (exosortase A-associated)
MKGLIFTYLMTYGGAAVALYRPYWGFLVYVCFSIIKPEALWSFSVPAGGNYSRIVGLCLLFGWTLKGFGSWHFGKAQPVITALIFYLLWSFPATLGGLDPEKGWQFVESMAKIVLPFLVGITMIENMDQLKQLAWVVLVSHGWVALELNRAYYDGFNIVQELGFGGMDNNCVAIAMVTCVGLGFFLGLHVEKPWQKGVAFACAGLTAHVIMLAFSRGGLLALIVTGVISFLLIPKKPIYYVYFAAAVLLAMRLAGAEVRERLETSFEPQQDYSARSRLELWSACWDIMVRKPLIGVGPEGFPQVAPEYGFPRGKKAHSLWLELGANMGFPGLLALVGFYGICLWRLWPITKDKNPVVDPWCRYLARMVIASIIGFAVAAQFVTLEGLEAPYYITLIGAGVLKLESVPSLHPPELVLAPHPAVALPYPAGLREPAHWSHPGTQGQSSSAS